MENLDFRTRERRGEVPAGVRMMQLLDARLPEIIRRERGNVGYMRLYGTGGYWTAFEQSAYQLCRLVPRAERALVPRHDGEQPVVMASITEQQFRRMSRKHIFSRDRADFKELRVAEIPVVHYLTWHRQVEDEFLSCLDPTERQELDRRTADAAQSRRRASASSQTAVRLEELLAARQQAILSRERDNDKLIYIYETVQSWVAFERSAFQLSRLFPGLCPSVLRMPGNPAAQVMLAVPDRTMRDYLSNHITRPLENNHRILLGEPLNPVRYAQWRHQFLKPAAVRKTVPSASLCNTTRP